VEISRLFTRVFCPKRLKEQHKHTRFSTKISMGGIRLQERNVKTTFSMPWHIPGDHGFALFIYIHAFAQPDRDAPCGDL
jgi:hypothetical protein